MLYVRPLSQPFVTLPSQPLCPVAKKYAQASDGKSGSRWPGARAWSSCQGRGWLGRKMRHDSRRAHGRICEQVPKTEPAANTRATTRAKEQNEWYRSRWSVTGQAQVHTRGQRGGKRARHYAIPTPGPWHTDTARRTHGVSAHKQAVVPFEAA